MEEKQESKDHVNRFNPNGVGLRNGHFIGLPFKENDARVIVLSLPWDVTVSFGAGTADGPEKVLAESIQLDLEDPAVPNAWQIGLYVHPPSKELRLSSDYWRKIAEPYITHLEEGGNPSLFQSELQAINQACAELHESVYIQSQELLIRNKIPGLLGGDHSTPFGLIRAIVEKYPDVGILQIDAHMDLRAAYEGFTWSHASIFYNVMQKLPLKKLVQVGIRDYCKEEMDFVQSQEERIAVFLDRDLRRLLYQGNSFRNWCEKIVEQLPAEVYISFDIDGLDPSLCPHTGTPVPGGLNFQEACFLLESIKESGRQIVGFDLCEVGSGDPWDANVGARILYKLANLAGSS